jgi:phage terminase, large subunit, PBSX family
MSLSYVIWAMTNFNEQNFGMCGKTIGSLRRNVINLLKIMAGARGYTVQDKRADNLLIISKGKITNYFWLFGGKDEASQDLIQGITLAGCFFDEVVLMPESFVNQATGRCSVDGSKFWFNDNPEGPYHWFKVKWIDQYEEKNMLYLHFTMDDNLSLSERIKNRYRSMYQGVFYDRYIRGLWCIAEGLIYTMFDPRVHVMDTRDIDRRDIVAYNISCDYGTYNPTVFLLWAKLKNGNHVILKEYYHCGREEGQKTDSEYAEDLMKFMAGYPVREIVVDPSAASFITELRKRLGSRSSIRKAKNDVLDGIRLVSSLLSQDILFVDRDCEMVKKEFGSYRWDEEASKHGTDRPIKEQDHTMDAIRYYCFTKIGNYGLRGNYTR